MSTDNLVRELQKIRDVLEKVDEHLTAKDRMNAALHMSENVRPTPLAGAVAVSLGSIDLLISEIGSNA